MILQKMSTFQQKLQGTQKSNTHISLGLLNTYDYYVKNHYGKRWTTCKMRYTISSRLMQTISKILMKW